MSTEREAALPTAADETPLDLRRYLQLLSDRRWWIVGTLASAMAVGLLYNRLQTPMYEARATLLVDTRSPRESGGEGDILSTLTGINRGRTLATQIEILRSASRMKDAALIAAAQDVVARERTKDSASRAIVEVPAGAVDDLQTVLRALRGRQTVTPTEMETLLVGLAQPDEPAATYPPGLAELEKRAGLSPGSSDLQSLQSAARKWLPQIAEQYQGKLTNLSLQGVRDTDIIAVNCQSAIPEAAAAYANGLARASVWRSLAGNREAAAAATRFVDDRLVEAQQDLDQKRSRLQDLLSKYQVVSVSDSATRLADRVQTLSSLASESRAQTDADRAGLGGLQRQMAQQRNTVTSSVTTTRNPALDKLQDQLLSLENERTALLEKVTERHPSVAALDAQIAGLKRQMADQVGRFVAAETRVGNPLGQQLLAQRSQAEVTLMADEARLRATEAGLSRAQQALARMPEVERGAAKLQQEVELAGNDVTALLERKQSLSLAQASEMAGASIVDPARVPVAPVSPNKRLNLIMAFLLGLIGGLSLALVVDHLDNTIKSAEDLERLTGVPVLAVVPRAQRDESPVLGGEAGHSRIGEAFRGLQTNLRYVSPDTPLQCLVITSAGAGEGKSTVVADLAAVSGELGHRVILVDTDLRRPSLAKTLGLPGEPGLTNCVVGDLPLEGVLQQTSWGNVSLVSAGPLPPNPAQVLTSARMDNLLAELRERADMVLFDSPPVGVVADAQMLASLVDGVILVVEAGKTRRPALEQALRNINRTGKRIVGTVLNKHLRRAGYYYYYYYHYYGGDYYHGSDKRGSRKSDA